MPVPPSRRKTASTRERLLNASLKAFGHNDYQAVSTREIVELAEANISAISYHFGGKKQLYLATAEYLAGSIRANLQKVIGDIESSLDGRTAEDCRPLLKQLIHALAHDILEGELSADAAGFIFREQLHPTGAFDILFHELMNPMQRIFEDLLACSLDKPTDNQQLKLLTHALLGQILIFRVGQTTILRRLGIEGFASPDITRIAELITSNTLAAIDARRQPDT